MRKISKSRTDDDVVSSTNGSVMNEDQAETEQPADLDDSGKGKDSESFDDSSEKNDDNGLDSPKETPKKGKGNKRGRKKKSGKEEKDASVEEEYEVCIVPSLFCGQRTIILTVCGYLCSL